MSALWVAEIRVSAAVAAKVRGKHGLDPDEVVAALSSPPVRVGRWGRDRAGRWRVLVTLHVRGRRVLVVLYPAGEDVWQLGSAYVIDRRRA